MSRKRKKNTGANRLPRTAAPIVTEGRERVVIDAVRPIADGGRFAIKRIDGEGVVVEADIFADGHDELSAALLYRHGERGQWIEVPMQPSANDIWRGQFQVTGLGDYYYTVRAWIDRFKSWRHGFEKKVAAGQDVEVELLTGAELVTLGAKRANGNHSKTLDRFAKALRADTREASRLGGRTGDLDGALSRPALGGDLWQRTARRRGAQTGSV
jgi:starch synthase (maltosyl-transferring)